MNVLNHIKEELNKVDEGVVPRRKRFIEPKESLACQKLLYPSKFRKDPYKQKRAESPMKDMKLPSIIKAKAQNS